MSVLMGWAPTVSSVSKDALQEYCFNNIWRLVGDQMPEDPNCE